VRIPLSCFGEELAEPCGHCDTCDAGSALVEDHDSADSPYQLNERVQHPEFGEGVVLRFEGDRIVVRFDEVGYRTLSLEAISANDLLSVVPATPQ
jgi:ATP-dependent DNA helicase RecQ